MKTVEELKGMSQEDLALLVNQLRENEKKAKENSDFWYAEKLKAESKYNKLKNLISSISALVE